MKQLYKIYNRYYLTGKKSRRDIVRHAMRQNIRSQNGKGKGRKAWRRLDEIEKERGYIFNGGIYILTLR